MSQENLFIFNPLSGRPAPFVRVIPNLISSKPLTDWTNARTACIYIYSADGCAF